MMSSSANIDFNKMIEVAQNNNWQNIKETLTFLKIQKIAVPDKVGTTLLVMATEAEQNDVINGLLDAGVDPVKTNQDGKSPLENAFDKKKWEVFDRLLVQILMKQKLKNSEYQDVWFENNKTTILPIIASEDWALIKFLIENKFLDINLTLANNENLLSNVIKSKTIRDKWEKSLWLILHNADVSKISLVDVLEIAKDYQWSLVAMLLKKGIKFDNNCSDAYELLSLAAADPEADDVLKFLVEDKNVDVNVEFNSSTALLSAIKGKAWQNVQYLIKHGAETHDIDKKIQKKIDKDAPQYVKTLIEDAHKITKLKAQCAGYKYYLLAQKNSEEKETEKVKGKLQALDELIAISDSKICPTKKLKDFNAKFEATELFHPKEEKGKTFKRVILAIVTGGIYALARCYHLGSFEFWKSKRAIFNEKIESFDKKDEMEIKTTFRQPPKQ